MALAQIHLILKDFMTMLNSKTRKCEFCNKQGKLHSIRMKYRTALVCTYHYVKLQKIKQQEREIDDIQEPDRDNG